MTRMQTGIDSARGGRARLHWQLAAARLCSQAGRQDLARHLLEGMEHTLRDPRLSQWEPQFLVRVMRLLLRTHEQLADKASRQRRDEIFQRLCHLDFDVVLSRPRAITQARTTHGQRRLGSTQGTHQRHLQPGYQWRPEELELPLKLMVLGDFTQREDERQIEDRKPISIDKHNSTRCWPSRS